MVSIMTNASLTNDIINKIDYSKILLEQKEVELMEKIKENIKQISNIKKEYKEYTDVTEEDGIIYLLSGDKIQKINKEKKKKAQGIIKNIQKDIKLLKKMNVIKNTFIVEDCFCTEEFINRFSEKLNMVL